MKLFRPLLMALTCTAAVISPPSFAQSGLTSKESPTTVKLTTGMNYSSGYYGDTDKTETLYVPMIAKVDFGDWAAKLTVPWLKIKGPGAVIGGGDGSITQGRRHVMTTEEGLGDIIGALSYSYYLRPYHTSFDFTGKIKFPTADSDKGLGTGEMDYTLMTEATRTIGKGYVSATVGRKFVGTNPDLHLHNIWLTSFGAGYTVMPGLSVGGSYDWRQSASNGVQPKDITVYTNYKFTPAANIQIYYSGGLSDGSADHSGGLMLGYKF